LETINSVDNYLPETSIRVAVYRILDYLLAQNVLKIGSIEGMEDHFTPLENILSDYLKEERTKFKTWTEYWTSLVHKNHQTPYILPDECQVEACQSIRRTIKELSGS
jgi:hypothetical protein